MQAAEQRAGFTLLEVLAAVAVLGLVYSVLATSAIQGMRQEGDAGHRLRASLLADQRITEIEAQVALGQTPELGETEDEEEEFLVRTEVRPLDLEVGDTKASKRAKDRLERAVGARPKGGQGEAGTLLHPAGGSKQPLLRRIDLAVVWTDGASEQSVRRTTFGLDAVAAAPLIEQLVAAAAAEKEQAAQQSQQSGADAASKSSATKSGTSTGASAGTAGSSSSQRLRSSTLPGTDPGTTGSDR